MTEKKCQSDSYCRRVLLARNQTSELSNEVMNFLELNAASINSENCYHIGNSSVLYRTGKPMRLENQGLENIALNFTAKGEEIINDDMRKIMSKFSQFKIYPHKPDPLCVDPDSEIYTAMLVKQNIFY